MNGKVIAYGNKGDPIIKPEKSERLVILTGYNETERPTIGSIIDYNLFKYGRNVDFVTLSVGKSVLTGTQTSNNKPVLDNMLMMIERLWDERFAKHMTEESRIKFPDTLKEIRNRCNKGDYEGAAEIADGCYKWALHECDFCEVSGPGFAYFTMRNKFKALEELIIELA